MSWIQNLVPLLPSIGVLVAFGEWERRARLADAKKYAEGRAMTITTPGFESSGATSSRVHYRLTGQHEGKPLTIEALRLSGRKTSTKIQLGALHSGEVVAALYAWSTSGAGGWVAGKLTGSEARPTGDPAFDARFRLFPMERGADVPDAVAALYRAPIVRQALLALASDGRTIAEIEHGEDRVTLRFAHEVSEAPALDRAVELAAALLTPALAETRSAVLAAPLVAPSAPRYRHGTKIMLLTLFATYFVSQHMLDLFGMWKVQSDGAPPTDAAEAQPAPIPDEGMRKRGPAPARRRRRAMPTPAEEQ